MQPPGRGFHVVASATEQFEVCLGNIRLLAGMMLDHGEKIDREQRLDYLRTIERKAGHLIEIAARLGDFAQISLGRKPLSRTKLRLSEIAAQAIDALTPFAVSRRHLLVFAQGAGEPPIAGDYRKLLRALCSLLRHSIEIAVPAAQILINVRPGRTELRLEINVPVDGMRRATEPESLLLSAAPLASESGLTKAVVAQILELHGGRLDSLASESHQRFVVALPVAA
jgi:signal transduction histidine kinase